MYTPDDKVSPEKRDHPIIKTIKKMIIPTIAKADHLPDHLQLAAPDSNLQDLPQQLQQGGRKGPVGQFVFSILAFQSHKTSWLSRQI